MPESTSLKVQFEGTPQKPIPIVAYAFDRQEKLVASADFKDGSAQLPLAPAQAQQARIFIAPAPPAGGAGKPTLGEMERLHAYEPVAKLDAKRLALDLLPIPPIHWNFWTWCSCRVRGRVVRPDSVRPGVQPVCHARVHICQVPEILHLLQRLAPPVLFRLRDAVIDAVAHPPLPPPPSPGFRFDPQVRDVSPINLARMQGVKAPVVRTLTPIVELNPQPEPPGAHFAAVTAPATLSVATRAALASPSAPIVRQALGSNIDLIRPHLALWPWLWPFFFSCAESAVVDTNGQGQFDALIWSLCADGPPDIYLWVEYCVGGTWTTVLHPPYPASTHWDYTCGSEIILEVTDPRVPGCVPPPELPGSQVAVLTIGNDFSPHQIQGATPSDREGLTTAGGQPFGGSIEPHAWFGSGLIAAGVTHYRWSYHRLGSGDGTWAAMDTPVIRHYSFIEPDDTLVFKPFLLGPDPDPALRGVFFKIQPHDPPAGDWTPQVDARSNTASAYLPSHLLDGGNAGTAAGKYELKLEFFKSDGTLVKPREGGVDHIALKVPDTTVDAPFGEVAVPTVAAGDEYRIKDAAGDTTAFRIVLHIDNNRCSASIDAPILDGHTANDHCGILGYATVGHAKQGTVTMHWTASHPNGFATYGFSLVRGATGLTPPSVGGAVVPPHPAVTMSVADLLQDCPAAGFSENLAVGALATDGWGRLSYLDASDVRAFALAPASILA